jgi:GNAT superfamily N-acetyltransferase
LYGQYKVRWFEEGDLDTYIHGLNDTLYEEYDEARFKWKMVDTPFSLGFVSIAVVEHKGRPVAFNSFLPLRVRRGVDSFPVVQGCDGFVEPEYRRMGLFQETLRFMVRELAGKGPEMLMGFNFAGSAGAAGKMGSTLTGDVYTLCMKPIELAKKTVEGEDEVEVTPCSLDKLHTLYEEWAVTTQKLHYYRTPKYLRWRYSHPIRRSSFYRLTDGIEIGYASVSLERENLGYTLFLEDYTPILHRPHVASALIKHILKHGYLINQVYITENVNSPMFKAARLIDFAPDHFYTLIMRNISGLEEREKRLFRGGLELSRIADWHITSSDVF